MNENTFPVYKVDTIVQFYRAEVLTGQEAKHFTKNDITPVPKPESIQRLYMRVLQLLFRFRPECHYTVPLSENLQHPMLYEWVTPIMSVYMRMCQFLPLCHVYDFSLNDLLNPKSKRTITILSAIQNFLHFRKQRLEMTTAHQQSFRSDMDRLQAYTREIKEAERKIEKLTTIPPEQQAEAKELASALAELTTNMQHEYQDVNAMNEKVAQFKTEIAEISQKLVQSLAAMNETLQKELKSLSSEEAQMKRALAMKLDKESKQQIRRQKKEVKDQQVKNIYGQYDKIHQKREEFVKMIEESNRETKQFKEKMQKLREKCNQQTQKAQEFYDRLLTTLEQYNKRIESIVVETNADTLKMKSHF
ncbi:kinetochore protein Nuf2 [Garra rufa]|uniref:kinetochore protein Nuf2 n=1 Tax=Garra rufa TaxID=137080 RepID=UPI003CCEB3E2